MRLFDPGPVVVKTEEPKPSGLVCLDLRTYPDETCVPEWRYEMGKGTTVTRRCRRCRFPV